MIDGIVWGRNFNRACRKLDLIKKDYLAVHTNVIYELCSNNEYKIIFKNGDCWYALSAEDGLYCGKRVNISYIDSTIDEETIHRIIRPCTSAPPYDAYNYYILDEE